MSQPVGALGCCCGGHGPAYIARGVSGTRSWGGFSPRKTNASVIANTLAGDGGFDSTEYAQYVGSDPVTWEFGGGGLLVSFSPYRRWRTLIEEWQYNPTVFSFTDPEDPYHGAGIVDTPIGPDGYLVPVVTVGAQITGTRTFSYSPIFNVAVQSTPNPPDGRNGWLNAPFIVDASGGGLRASSWAGVISSLSGAGNVYQYGIFAWSLEGASIDNAAYPGPKLNIVFVDNRNYSANLGQYSYTYADEVDVAALAQTVIAQVTITPITSPWGKYEDWSWMDSPYALQPPGDDTNVNAVDQSPYDGTPHAGQIGFGLGSDLGRAWYAETSFFARKSEVMFLRPVDYTLTQYDIIGNSLANPQVLKRGHANAGDTMTVDLPPLVDILTTTNPASPLYTNVTGRVVYLTPI